MRLLLIVLTAALVASVPVPVAAQRSDQDLFSGFVDELGGLQVGGLYAINLVESSFRVAKVLALNRQAVHVRVYGNHYASPPGDIDPAELDIRASGDPQGWGIGHLPLTWDLFASWQPHFLRAAEVTAEELDGFHEWQHARGGVFAGPGGRQAILRLLSVGP